MIRKMQDVETMTKVSLARPSCLSNNDHLNTLVNWISYQLFQDAYSRRFSISITWSHVNQT
jgi:hypothetical protein